MASSPNIAVDIVIACICGTLILSRCVYRIYHRFKGHAGSHRLWHGDDIFMAVALLPLVTRTICISLSFALNPSHIREPPTEREASAEKTTLETLRHDRILGLQLLIGARLGYALLYGSSQTVIDSMLNLIVFGV
ncbi:hypothetical protein CABS01_10356 [Colletotrichum abscissum]|uniref:Uncharacterized protein n=1 Tax=Colletotrichum abscissum TaxID=1671311 RepID=A0A9P9XP19_9PEZI|nr:uncharacterized protein CABS01_10356 [Colletotrichum abscissum]KAI3557116.1 hypothetical protein CABS02_02667 [Colletotrichum abscissum]KAK1499958.1 hypothetical protein CABS01_10356 [Colletotrichum abscissum]